MRLPKARTVSYAIAGLFCAASIFFLITAYRCRRDFYRWQVAQPIDIAIDLSKPGEFVGAFKQTCHISHGEALCLLLPSNMVATMTWKNLLRDVRFIARIQDETGNKKVREEFTGDLIWGNYLLDGAIPLIRFAPFENGDYRLTLTVTGARPPCRVLPSASSHVTCFAVWR